jgi:cell division protein FtsB
MTSSSASAAAPKFWGGYKYLGLVALPLAVVMVLVLLFSHRGLYQIYRLRHERILLEQENNRLAAENNRLARTIDRLQHDPILIQDLIRQELNFVKKNEIIFQFPPEKPAAVNSGSLNPEPTRVRAVSASNVGKPQRFSPSAAGPGFKGNHRRDRTHP